MQMHTRTSAAGGGGGAGGDGDGGGNGGGGGDGPQCAALPARSSPSSHIERSASSCAGSGAATGQPGPHAPAWPWPRYSPLAPTSVAHHAPPPSTLSSSASTWVHASYGKPLYENGKTQGRTPP